MFSNFILKQWVSIPSGDDAYMWCIHPGDIDNGKYYMNATAKPAEPGSNDFEYMTYDGSQTNHFLSAFVRIPGTTIP